MNGYARAVVAVVFGVSLAGLGTSLGAHSSSLYHGASANKLGLLTPGILTVGSDTTYPPMEYADPTHPGTFIGADIDLANAMAKKMGLKGAKIVSGGFDSLISSLMARRFDVIYSSMNDTPARRKLIDYVDYMKAEEGILVPANSKIHANSYTGMCGLTVAAEKGTTEQYGLEAANKVCKKKITIMGYTADTDAYQAFNSGHAQAYTTDIPVVAYYIKNNPGKYRMAGKPIILTNYGIGVRKGSTALKKSLQTALKAVMKNGQYKRILKHWGLSAAAL